jgi:hypothetical protein
VRIVKPSRHKSNARPRGRRRFGNVCARTIPDTFRFEHRGHLLSVYQMCSDPEVWRADIFDEDGVFWWLAYSETMERARDAAAAQVNEHLRRRRSPNVA